MVKILNEGFFRQKVSKSNKAGVNVGGQNDSSDVNPESFQMNSKITKNQPKVEQTVEEFVSIIKEQYPDSKIAIVHQSLWKMRGGERMVKMLADGISKIDLYALFGNRNIAHKEFANHRVRFSWLQYIPFIQYLYRYSIPLWPFTFSFLLKKKYDLVISFSSSFAKGINTNGHHIAIILSPPRYLWDMTEQYYKAAFWLRRVPMFLFYTPLRIYDVLFSQKPHEIYAISQYVAKRVKKYYGRNVNGLIYPMIEVPKAVWEGRLHNQKEDFYLSISPFEENKGADKVFENTIKFGLKLKVIGGGNLEHLFIKKYGKYPNIEFLGAINDAEKWRYISRAKALLMFGIEDWGTIQLEAAAAGCPVIAYGRGGALENIKDGVTGILLSDLSESSLSHALASVGNKSWSHAEMKEWVKRFVRVI